MAKQAFNTTAPVPITQDAQGVFRLKGSRVTLESVIASVNSGATAEEIVQQFPTLKLQNIYLVIGFYLLGRRQVEQYLQEQRAKAGVLRVQIESKQDIAQLQKN